VDLYLVRHAIAFGRDDDQWPDDSARPLSPEGEALFEQAARGLGRVASSVDLVLSSPFVRAWRTAEILQSAAGWPAPEESAALEAGRPTKDVMAALDQHAELQAVALVGHEPDLSELASYLLSGSGEGLLLEMKKGGVGCLRVDDLASRGSASLKWWLTPKILRALAPGRRG
jgi:phosphohistidine phosphatase